jgi:signal transduction histidine kinase
MRSRMRKAEVKDIDEEIEELKHSNKTKDKIISILAHDLKSQIGSIASIISFLYSDYERFTDDERKKLLLTLNGSSDQIISLLENSLYWAYSKLGKLEFNKTKVGLKDLVDNVVNQLDDSLKMKGIKIINKITKAVTANIDDNMVSTAIKNIVSNSIKFSPRGGKIQINSKKAEKNLEIIISDYGIGIKKEDLKKIFDIELNQRSLGTDEETGSGLGLMVSKEFIERNDGKIEIFSIYRKGTDVKITLPI